MDKITNTSKYYNVVRQNSEFFKRYYYHALLDLNLIKLDYILKNGILSKNEIERQKLIGLYTHSSNDFDSKNGSTFISLSEYTSRSSLHPMFESFPLHTLSSISLLLNKGLQVYKKGERETYFDDEVFVNRKIDKSLIEGIILPSHLTDLPISRINPLPNDLSCFTKRYLFNWLKCTENYFNQKIPSEYIEELRRSYENLWKILSSYESPEKWFSLAIRKQREENGKDLKDILAAILEFLWSIKFNMNKPSYIEIIQKLNEDKLPVYEIGEKTLRKIN